MLIITDKGGLYLIEFFDQNTLGSKVDKLKLQTKDSLSPGSNYPIQSMMSDIFSHFKGTLRTFETPWHQLGSPFQKLVWESLSRVPYGGTCSYADQAEALGKPTAHRAVANANGANYS